jgi:hypothetical protein
VSKQPFVGGVHFAHHCALAYVMSRLSDSDVHGDNMAPDGSRPAMAGIMMHTDGSQVDGSVLAVLQPPLNP